MSGSDVRLGYGRQTVAHLWVIVHTPVWVVTQHVPASHVLCNCFTLVSPPPLCIVMATEQVILLDWQSEETSHLYSTMSASGSNTTDKLGMLSVTTVYVSNLFPSSLPFSGPTPLFRAHPHCRAHQPLEGSLPLECSLSLQQYVHQ